MIIFLTIISEAVTVTVHATPYDIVDYKNDIESDTTLIGDIIFN